MKLTFKKLTALTLILMLSFSLILTGCTPNQDAETKEIPKEEAQTEEKQEESKAETQKEEATPFRIGVTFNPTDSLDASNVTSPGGSILSLYVYGFLFMTTPEGPVPYFAESYSVNDNVDEWTIVLREGLKYSDGSEATGQDVLDSLINLSKSPIYMSMYTNVDFEQSSADGKSATIKLKEPASDFLISVLGMWSPIAPKGEFKGIGAGPYIVEGGESANGYTLKSNPLYWSGEPKISSVSLLNISDPTALMNALNTGEIDYAFGLNAAAIKSLRENPDLVIPEPSLDSAVAKILGLNTRIAPFNDPELRRAAKLAIDREKLVNVLLGETGELGNDMLGKGFASYPDDIPQRTADKDEAKRIFKEKGVSEFTILASDILPGQVASAELIAQEFDEIGVKVSVEEMDGMEFFSRIPEVLQYSAFTFYFINRDPINEVQMELLEASPYNLPGYSSDVIHENYKKYLSTMDQSVQLSAIRAILEDNYENGAEIIWGYQRQLNVHRKGLSDFQVFQSIPWIDNAVFN